MKIRKLFFISLSILFVFLIYLTTVDKKIYYLNIGDSVAMGINSYKIVNNGYDRYVIDYLKKEDKLEKYINHFNQNDLRITDLFNMINSNHEIKIDNHSQSIKNALIKADIVTLSIGNDDFYQKLNNNYTVSELFNIVDEYKNDLEKLLILMRKYCKEDIIMLGYYNPYFLDSNKNKVVLYMNEKMTSLAKDYDVKYINIHNLITPNEILNPKDYHISNKGYKLISKEIIKIIKKDIL